MIARQSTAESLAGAATVDKQTVTLKDKINLPRGPRTSDILPTETMGFHASNEHNSPCATVPYPRDLFRDNQRSFTFLFPRPRCPDSLVRLPACSAVYNLSTLPCRTFFFFLIHSSASQVCPSLASLNNTRSLTIHYTLYISSRVKRLQNDRPEPSPRARVRAGLQGYVFSRHHCAPPCPSICPSKNYSRVTECSVSLSGLSRLNFFPGIFGKWFFGKWLR